MSDTVRVYGGLKRGARKVRRQRYGGKVFVAAVLIAAGWVYWTTRDTHPVQSLIPANRAYHVVARDVFAKRARLAESKIWKALPPQLGVADVPAKLSQDVGVPQWILNNVVPGACYVMGNDIKGFGDVLVVTRMTRVGTLLEKLRAFFPGIEGDYAGGLKLHKMGGLYYGVRGRVLLLSASRPGLIEALTLLPDAALTAGALDEMPHSLGDADIYGRFQLAEDDPLGDVIERGTFSLRIDKTAATAACQSVLRPAWREKMAALLDGVTPRTLEAPPDGLLRVSLDLGKPVAALWNCAGTVFGKQNEMDQLWAKWSAAPEEGESSISYTVLGILGGLGPGMRASLVGVDLNEIVPAPEVVATLEADPAKLLEAFKALPAPPAGSQPWDTYLRYDETAQVVWLPLIGGPSLEPTAGVKGNALVMSSSRTVAESMLADPATSNPPDLPKPGNVYAALKPHDCGKAAFDVAMMLAEAGLLRDYSPQTLQEKYGPWLESAAGVKEVSALAGYDSGNVMLELGLVCSDTAPVKASQ
ncbi:MAG TPA: hypothetical protein VMZ06_09020 [Candidatus Bathyarchaeia archaeon]|nr:hypothetical protein [Candidatus Bathyarchaeia archaeon]